MQVKSLWSDELVEIVERVLYLTQQCEEDAIGTQEMFEETKRALIEKGLTV